MAVRVVLAGLTDGTDAQGVRPSPARSEDQGDIKRQAICPFLLLGPFSPQVPEPLWCRIRPSDCKYRKKVSTAEEPEASPGQMLYSRWHPPRSAPAAPETSVEQMNE